MKRPSNGRHLNIPIELINYVLREKLCRPAALYFYLLLNTSGNFDIERVNKCKILSDLNVKKWETIRRRLKVLIELGWIYPKNKVFYIKGMTSVTMEHNPISSMGAVFDSIDFKKIKGFLIGASIAYGQRLKKRQGKYSVSLQGETTGNPYSSSCLPTGQIIYSHGDEVANIYLGQILGFSKTTGSNFKRCAKLSNYIVVKHNYANLNLSLSSLNSFKRVYPEIAHKVISRRNSLYVQLPDRVQSYVRLRKVRSLRRLLPFNKVRHFRRE